jgi:hypothetical protein
VQVEVGGCLAIDLRQEAEELPAALARQAFPDDLAIQQAECGKQRGCPVIAG